MTKECYTPWTHHDPPLRTLQCCRWDETKQTCTLGEPCPKPWEVKRGNL